jgi:hypothetical protein
MENKNQPKDADMQKCRRRENTKEEEEEAEEEKRPLQILGEYQPPTTNAL